MPADGEGQKPHEGDGCSGKDSEDEGFDGSLQAEPRAEQAHELGVAEAHAFLAADDPVEKPDEQDDGCAAKDGEEGYPGEVKDGRKLAELLMWPVADEGEEEAEGRTGEGEDVGEPEVFEIEYGEGGEQPTEDGKTEGGNERRGEIAVIWEYGKERWSESIPAGCPEDTDCELDYGIAEADGGAALAAAAAKDKPAQEGDVFPPGEDVIAMAAVGARGCEAFFFREADENDVEEAAEGESEQEREEGGCVPDCVDAGDGLLPVRMNGLRR